MWIAEIAQPRMGDGHVYMPDPLGIIQFASESLVTLVKATIFLI